MIFQSKEFFTNFKINIAENLNILENIAKICKSIEI